MAESLVPVAWQHLTRMDYTISWGGDPEDVCMTTRGVASVADLDAMVREAVADGRWAEGMRVLLDHTRTDWTQMTANEIEERAQLMIAMADEVGYQFVAWVGRSERDLAVARLLALIEDWQVRYVARAFTSLDEARAWLRRPTASLPHVTPKPQEWDSRSHGERRSGVAIPSPSEWLAAPDGEDAA